MRGSCSEEARGSRGGKVRGLYGEIARGSYGGKVRGSCAGRRVVHVAGKCEVHMAGKCDVCMAGKYEYPVAGNAQKDNRKVQVSLYWFTNAPPSRYNIHRAQNSLCTYVFLQDVCPGRHYTPHSGMIYPCGFLERRK